MPGTCAILHRCIDGVPRNLGRRAAQACATLILSLAVLNNSALAQTRTWDGGGADNNWSTAGNWSSNNVPNGTGEAALFTDDPVGQTKLSPNLSADVTIGQLQYSATAPSYTITGSGPSTLFLSPNASFGGVGITAASGAANQTVSTAEVEFLSSQTWDIGGSMTLLVSGTIEDDSMIDYGLTKNGTGRLVLPGDVRYDGPTTVNAGELVLSFNNTSMLSALTVNDGLLRATTKANALGSSSTRNTITLAGGTLELANDTGLTFGATGRSTQVTGNTTIRSDRLTTGAGVTLSLGTLRIGAQSLSVEPGPLVTSGTAGITFGATTLTGDAKFDVVNTDIASAQLTLGAITESVGAHSLTKSGSGALNLTATNSYSGNTTVEAGKLSLTNRGLKDSADVFLATGSTLELKFSGTPDIIDSLFIDGDSQFTGTWGAPGSGAQHTSALLAGPGWLQVSTFVLVGDYNNSGAVDAADYVTWRHSVGSSSIANRDPKNTGPIGPADYESWYAKFGAVFPPTGNSSTTTTTIPEPANLSACILAAFAILFCQICPRRAAAQIP